MPQEYTRTRPIPLFEIHGTEDRVSEWTGDLEDKGGWGAYIPVPDAVEYWVERNGCKREITDTLYLKGESGHQTISHKYVDPRSGCEVWLYEVVGAGHTWFNDDMETAEEIWKFFSKYIK
jgi:polyhydroxybutyrate depolymerase